MSLIALCSAKGSPGVTVAALALTLTWRGPVVLAECDPAGGTVQAGFLAGALPADRGIRELAVAELRGDDLDQKWWGQLIDLRPPRRAQFLLPGITDPVQAGALQPVWARLGGFFTQLEHRRPGVDVIADCGRLISTHTPWPLLTAADAVLLVVPPTLPGMSAAVPALRLLRAQLDQADAGHTRLGLLLCGRGEQSTRTVTSSLRTPVVAQLPHDPRTARVLSRGGALRTGAALLTAAQLAGREIARHTAGTRRAAAAATGEGR